MLRDRNTLCVLRASVVNTISVESTGLEMGRNQVVEDLTFIPGDEEESNSHPAVYDLLMRDVSV